MKNWLYLFLFTILFGCAGSLTRTAFEAERHRMDMMDIKTNMSMDEVRDRMGVPKKIERRAMNGIEYEIWYYMTMGVYLDQTRLIDENFTPFVFYGTCLRGWGWKFYNHLFDINNARYRREEDRKKTCTDSDIKRSSYEHRVITPYKDEKKLPEQEALEKFIKSAAEEKAAPAKSLPKAREVPVTPSTSIEKTMESGTEKTDVIKKTLPGQSLEVIHKPLEEKGIPTGETSPTIIEQTPIEVVPKVKGQPSGSTTPPSQNPPGSTTPTTVQPNSSLNPPGSTTPTTVQPNSSLNPQGSTTPITVQPNSSLNPRGNTTPTTVPENNTTPAIEKTETQKYSWW